MILALIAAQAAALPYRALGTEPFWHLTIGRETLRLERLGEPPRTVRRESTRRTAGSTRYIGRNVRVMVRRAPCSDGMSDKVYPDTVTVRWNGRLLTGCGWSADHDLPPSGGERAGQ